jgi:hypothetical protein
MGLFARFRSGRMNKDEAFVVPESSKQSTGKKGVSPTRADDTELTHEENNNIEDSNGRDKSQLKAVRFPANDALKTAPGRSRRELQKPPTAREAAYGGPPRYDWIDIVSLGVF